MSYENSQAFTDLYASIKSQMENLHKEWSPYPEEEDFDEFFEFYCNHENSLTYYKIDDEEMINESYREGSKWILKMMNDECGFSAKDIVETLEKISNDNEEYKKQLIFWIGYEM